MASEMQGQFLKLSYYLQVTGQEKGDYKCRVLNSDNKGIPRISVGQGIIEKNGEFASLYDETQSLGRAALAEKFAELKPGAVFEASFLKKDGSERILIGIKTASQNALGQTLVIDLEADDSRVRTIDHRTLVYFIADRVKYTLAK